MTDAPLYLSRYPHHDVLERADDWDEETRRLVLERVRRPPVIRFFTQEEAATLGALSDVVIPQEDRPLELRVPLVSFLDERLHLDQGRGYRYEPLPPDRELWRLVAAALDDEARRAHGRGFAELDRDAREALFRRYADGAAESPLWERLPPERALPQILLEWSAHYYGHPYAWDEVGFPGPKFPGIYARTQRDNPDEPREVAPDGA